MLSEREVAGFAVAPLPILVPIIVLCGVVIPDTDIYSELLQLIVLSYVVMLLIGLPTHLLLRRTGRKGLLAYLGATLLGILVLGGILVILEKLFLPEVRQNPFAFILWSQYGAMALASLAIVAVPTALVFWWVSVRPPRAPAPAAAWDSPPD